jgi:hypothetical protein
MLLFMSSYKLLSFLLRLCYILEGFLTGFLKITVLSDVNQFSLLDKFQCIRGTCCFHV